MFFDSHAHLNNEMSDEARAAMVRAIEDSELDYVMDIGFDLPSSKLAVDHAAKYPRWAVILTTLTAWMTCSWR